MHKTQNLRAANMSHIDRLQTNKILPVTSAGKLPAGSLGTRMPLTSRSSVFENQVASNASTNAFCLVTKKQLAQQLALSSSYISKLMCEEGLPHLKIGRAVRFRPKEVVEWLEKRKMP